jgi:hypothetical protein
MKKLVYISILCAIIFSVHSCIEQDEYAAPGETLTGSVIDVNTGEPIRTEQGSGIRIRLEETSWSDEPVPTYFWVKQDGTFNNSKVFRGTYTVTPVDGPYFPIEGKSVEINGTTEVDFEVEPFLNVEITNLEQNGGDVEVSFTISRSTEAFKITDARVFVSNTQYVGNNTYLNNKTGQDLTPTVNLNSTPDDEILSTTHTLDVVGMESGRTYYLRVGARTNDDVQRRYNYSEIVPVTVP